MGKSKFPRLLSKYSARECKALWNDSFGQDIKLGIDSRGCSASIPLGSAKHCGMTVSVRTSNLESLSGLQFQMDIHPNPKRRDFWSQGADVNWKDEAGMDALMWAVTENKPILVELLIQVCTTISIYTITSPFTHLFFYGA
jgi:hypothetical protein